MDWHLIVPGAPELRRMDLSAAREVRLRPGQPVWAALPEGPWQGEHKLSPGEVTRAAQALSGHGLAAWQEELARGFLPLPGGHRMGVCGRMGANGWLEITSLCVRLAHEVKGAGTDLFPLVQGESTLILGPPGSGKTTLLRDLIRLHSLAGRQTAVADERGEIAACRDGAPQLDVGPATDVITGLDKARALPLLIRTMAPDLAAVDELGGEEDARAVMDALRSGVSVLATIHARSVEEAEKRAGMAALFSQNAFSNFVLLSQPGQKPELIRSLREG